nr:hypothetical protein (nodB 3' region) - Azorhizobium caulinodans [Azorhizobium caulinodans]
MRRVDKKRDAR